MVMTKALVIFLALFVVLPSTSASAGSRRPHEVRSFKPQHLHKVGGRCSYIVLLRTSCFSPRSTRDRISLAFGDISLNEVYVANLEGRFESCALEKFVLEGPCMSGVCFLYVYRQGEDGWIPEWVTVKESDADAVYPFDFSGNGDSPIPSDVWVGFDECPLPPMPKTTHPHDANLTRPTSAAAAAQA